MTIFYKLNLSAITNEVCSVTKSGMQDGRVLSIPFDPANRDYQEYLTWLAEGNEPLPADSE